MLAVAHGATADLLCSAAMRQATVVGGCNDRSEAERCRSTRQDVCETSDNGIHGSSDHLRAFAI